MSATNATTNYSLPLFIGSDKPAWLTDWNGAMNAIDTALANIATAEGGTATALAAISTAVEGLSTTVGQHTTTLTTLTTTVNGNTGSINTINSLIGNGTPTTTDKTLIGAINEINAKVAPEDIQVETLAASGTSVEFDVPTSGDNLIDFYVSDGSQPTAIDTSVTGKVTLTFTGVAYARSVFCKIETVTVSQS